MSQPVLDRLDAGAVADEQSCLGMAKLAYSRMPSVGAADLRIYAHDGDFDVDPKLDKCKRVQ
jgi:hypothetical protein